MGSQGKGGDAGLRGRGQDEVSQARGLVLGPSPRVGREARGFGDQQGQSLKSVPSLKRHGSHVGVWVQAPGSLILKPWDPRPAPSESWGPHGYPFWLYDARWA